MTVVQPDLQWGVAELDGDRVAGFVEKPRSERWINGGFFCFDPGVLAYLDAESVLEREPLARLAAEGQLRAFRHDGFWDCMDTYKDAVVLNDLWAGGDAPWRVWDAATVELVKRALVTGGHGFVASHLARALLERGDAGRPCLDLAPPPLSGLALQGIADEVELVEADLRDSARVGAMIESSEFDVVFHLGAQTLVGPAMSDPTRDLRDQRARHLDPARGLPPGGGAGDRRRLLRQGLRRRARSCPTARTCSCARPRRTRRARRRPTRSPSATGPPTGCRSRSPASPTSTAAATSTSRA